MDRRHPRQDIAESGPFIPSTLWSGGAVRWAQGQSPKLAHSENLLITFGFRCNLACTFCLVEDGLDQLRGISLDTFAGWLQTPALFEGVTRVILSGGEATLEPELLQYAQLARQVPSVEHVRIQTNGMRLADRSYLQRLIDVGIDEYFVSVHGWDEPSTARITQRTGAFRTIVAGLEQVAASTATLFTNTCICTDNFEHLVDVVDVVAPFHPAQVSLWTQHPRLDSPERRQMMAPVAAVQPHLMRALDRCDALGQPALVKWFPRCLLGPHAAKHDDSQPTTLVEPEFWPQVPQYSCIYATVCAHGRDGCGGLPHQYIEEFGWEEDVLRPAPLQMATERAKPELPLHAAELAQVQALTAQLGLDALVTAHGWRIADRLRRSDAQSNAPDALRLVLATADGASTWLELNPSRNAPGLVQTARFSLSHGRVQGGDEGLLRGLLQQLRVELPQRDVGGPGLPWCRG